MRFGVRYDGALCSVDGCMAPAVARGWCTRHYARWCTHGNPHIVKPSIALRHGGGWRPRVPERERALCECSHSANELHAIAKQPMTAAHDPARAIAKREALIARQGRVSVFERLAAD